MEINDINVVFLEKVCEEVEKAGEQPLLRLYNDPDEKDDYGTYAVVPRPEGMKGKVEMIVGEAKGKIGLKSQVGKKAAAATSKKLDTSKRASQTKASSRKDSRNLAKAAEAMLAIDWDYTDARACHKLAVQAKKMSDVLELMFGQMSKRQMVNRCLAEAVNSGEVDEDRDRCLKLAGAHAGKLYGRIGAVLLRHELSKKVDAYYDEKVQQEEETEEAAD